MKFASLSSQNEIKLLGLSIVKMFEPPQTDNYPQFIDIRELLKRSFDAPFDSSNSFAVFF